MGVGPHTIDNLQRPPFFNLQKVYIFDGLKQIS